MYYRKSWSKSCFVVVKKIIIIVGCLNNGLLLLLLYLKSIIYIDRERERERGLGKINNLFKVVKN